MLEILEECPEGQTKSNGFETAIQNQREQERERERAGERGSHQQKKSDTQQTIIIEVLTFTSHSLSKPFFLTFYKNHSQFTSLCCKKEKSAEMSLAHWLDGGGDSETFTSGSHSEHMSSLG